MLEMVKQFAIISTYQGNNAEANEERKNEQINEHARPSNDRN